MKRIKAFLLQSIRARLAFYFTLTFGTTLILVSGFCYQIFVRTHQEHFDLALYNHAIDVASAIDTGIFGGIRIQSFDFLETGKQVPFAIGRSVLILRDLGGRRLAGSQSPQGAYTLPFDDKIRTETLTKGVAFSTIDGGPLGAGRSRDYRLITTLVEKPGMAPFILQIAAPLTIILESQRTFFLALLFIIPLGILLSMVLALWASRRAFSPILHMTQQTAQIEMTDLRKRIEIIETDEELKELSRTLNQLLDRIEASVQAQDRFVADASHQLKTPLAIIQGELELLNPDRQNAALTGVQQEVAQLARLVENLLLLARMDAGYDTVPFSTVRLDEVVTESVQRFERLAGKQGIKLTVDLVPDRHGADSKIDFELQGDTYLLRCLVENLIDNAMKYSRDEDRRVDVRLEEHSDRCVLEVSDRGHGLTPDEIEKLFLRFQRDPKKSLRVQGAGLGLVIVKRIADLHRATIQFDSRPGQGTRVRVEFAKK